MSTPVNNTVTDPRIAGRQTFIDRNGREVSYTASHDPVTGKLEPGFRERRNGPHHDAKWARDVLGTPTQAEVRARNLRTLFRNPFNELVPA